MSTTSLAATSSSRSRSSSPRCVPFAFRRGAGARRARGLPPVTPPPAAGAHPAVGTGGCGRPLCRAAEAVSGGVRDAFFASLDRCSCVEVGTMSFKEPETMPLMMPPDGADRRAPPPSSASAGKTQQGCGGGSSRRRGLGCCSANSTSVN
ncbi:hypothetical protein BS78_08G167900 [Paspalum vaginatum]|nr:hypothetical protein BS78_08G167900 [Paspalum vaginatum]